MKSPTYNTMQVCKKAQCPFDTSPDSGTENLDIPQYAHAVVMGVNKASGARQRRRVLHAHHRRRAHRGVRRDR